MRDERKSVYVDSKCQLPARYRAKADRRHVARRSGYILLPFWQLSVPSQRLSPHRKGTTADLPHGTSDLRAQIRAAGLDRNARTTRAIRRSRLMIRISKFKAGERRKRSDSRWLVRAPNPDGSITQFECQ